MQHGCVRGLRSRGTLLAGTHQEEVLGNWGLGMVGDERIFWEDGAAQERSETYGWRHPEALLCELRDQGSLGVEHREQVGGGGGGH